MDNWGEPKANNQPVATRGLLTTTAGPDLLHTLPTVVDRTAKIVKVLWYNNTGALVTLIFGTVDNVAPAGWVPLFPTIVAINGLDGGYEEAYLPDIEFARDTSLGVLGVTGDIYVQASAAGVLVRLEVQEKGA